HQPSSLNGISAGFLVGEIVIFLSTFAGLLLNLLVFYILAIRIRILKIDAVLSILITVLDVTGLVALLAHIIYKWATSGYNLPSQDFMFCKTTGTIIFGSTISSIDIVCILGLIRCLIIVYKRNFHSLLWTAVLGILLAYNWIGGGIFVWYFDEVAMGKFCQRDDNLLKEYGLSESKIFHHITAVKSLVMLLILCISYSLIYRFYLKYFDSMKGSSNSDQSYLVELNSQRSVTSIKLIALIASYIITYGPKVYLLFISTFELHGKVAELELTASVLFSLTSIVNASVILFIQEETKQEWQIITTLFAQRVKYNLKR
ncbi:hypothetical protein CONCODRAFT_80827, partial [Conidiobolus coronatus NRRL 28638]